MMNELASMLHRPSVAVNLYSPATLILLTGILTAVPEELKLFGPDQVKVVLAFAAVLRRIVSLTQKLVLLTRILGLEGIQARR